MRQVRLWDDTADLIDKVVERSVAPTSVTTIANMAIVRGLKILEKEIALKPGGKEK